MVELDVPLAAGTNDYRHIDEGLSLPDWWLAGQADVAGSSPEVGPQYRREEESYQKRRRQGKV